MQDNKKIQISFVNRPMRLLRAFTSLFISWLHALKAEVKLCMVLCRHPTLRVARPTQWQYDSLYAFEIGKNVWIGAFTEIVAYKRHRLTRVAGKLVLGDDVIIGAGCNIRAAGGVILMGNHSGVGQNSVLVAANHQIILGKRYLRCEWDEQKTGITIGSNCWVASNCVVLPGVTIGDNSVIGAGSVVTKSVPPNEIWAGIPARFVKKVTETSENTPRGR